MANMDDIFRCTLHLPSSPYSEYFKALPCLQIAQIPRQGCLSVFAWSIKHKAESCCTLLGCGNWGYARGVRLQWVYFEILSQVPIALATAGLPCCHIATVPRCQAAIPIQLTRRRRRPVNAVQRWKVAAISNVPNHGQIAWLSTKKIFSQK